MKLSTGAWLLLFAAAACSSNGASEGTTTFAPRGSQSATGNATTSGATGASTNASSAASTSGGASAGAGTASSTASATGTATTSSAGATGSSGQGLSSSNTSGSPSAGTSGTTGSSSGATSGATTGAGTGSTGGATTGGTVADPAQVGPYTYAELDATTTSAKSGDSVPLHCAYPTAGPSAGPYPVIVFAPGFQIPPDQYYMYAQWLAGFGYVAIVANYPQSAFSPNHVAAAQDLSAALDWATSVNASGSGSPLSGLVDVTKAGVSGHSLGGKLSILAASYDPRFKASLTLDPVDGSMSCNQTDCPNAIDALPLAIPTGFLGETLDETPVFVQACASAADNFQTLYAKAGSPSFEVTIAGAGHLSFISSISGCGLVCSFCQTPTAPQAQVISMAEAYLVAFYELNLKGNAGDATYLTGAEAQTRYVATSEASIVSK